MKIDSSFPFMHLHEVTQYNKSNHHFANTDIYGTHQDSLNRPYNNHIPSPSERASRLSTPNRTTQYKFSIKLKIQNSLTKWYVRSIFPYTTASHLNICV